jgi:hypothetical protein
VVFLVTDNDRAAAIGLHDAPLRNGIHGVVGTLAVHFGLQQQQQPLDSSVAEQHDVVNRLKCGNDFCALVRWNDRSPWTLQRGDRPIVVDGDYETIRFSRRTAQVSNVTDVHQIEASIRQSDAPTLGAVTCHCVNEPIFCKDFAHISTTSFQPPAPSLHLTAPTRAFTFNFPPSTFNFTDARRSRSPL